MKQAAALALLLLLPAINAVTADESYTRAMGILQRDYLDFSASDASSAQELLAQCLTEGHRDGIRLLADLHFFGRGPLKPNFDEAARLYGRLADDGDAASMHMLGLMHHEGLGVPQDAAKSLVLHTFAAKQDFRPSHMALAYRYLNEHSVPADCMQARAHYLRAATQLADIVRNDPRRAAGISNQRSPQKFTDDMAVGGGLLGRVKRLLGLPLGVRDPAALGPREPHTQRDIVEFYQYAQGGKAPNASAHTLIGHVYYFGTAEMKPSLLRAFEAFQRAARQGSTLAHALLGLMYMRGDALPEPDYRRAYTHFRIAMKRDDPVAVNGMGVLYWHGWGVIEDRAEALRLFKKAAEAGYPEAYFNTAVLLAEEDPVGQQGVILTSLLAAVQGGYAMANYEFVSRFLRAEGSCHLSVLLLSQFMERVDVPAMFADAVAAYAAGHFEAALTRYLFLAEQGHVTAQHNAAFILEHHGDTEDEQLRAQTLWRHAASQGDPAARLRVGDYQYRKGRYADAAAAYYQAIKDTKYNSAQAYFNLGYMYARGIGLKRDFWMAYRYYAGAIAAHPVAWAPAGVAIFVLTHARTISQGLNALAVAGVLSLGVSLLVLLRKRRALRPSTYSRVDAAAVDGAAGGAADERSPSPTITVDYEG